MEDKGKKKLVWTILLHAMGFVVLVGFVSAVYLTEGFGQYRVGYCRIHEMFGFYCPGCGGTRAVFYLLRGQFVRSFLAYPAVPLTSLLILYWDVLLGVSLVTKKQGIMRWFPKWLWLTIPLLLLVQFFLRNLLLYTINFDPLQDLYLSLVKIL